MKSMLFLSLMIISQTLFAQQKLTEYIQAGLESNLALQQKEDNYRRSLEILRESRGLFYPSISLNARYTVSEGGRVIEFPVGELLNGVYSTLNTLTSTETFPQLEDQEIAFLRPTEQETKIRLVQQVFNPDIYYNARIKNEIAVSERIGVEQYRRELVAEIKKAYYSTAMTLNIVEMLVNMRDLVLENVRINESLLENDKITRDILLRSKTELYKLDQQIVNANKNYTLAAAYFNFLLNRSPGEPVIIEKPDDWALPEAPLEDYVQQALENREEIKNLQQFSRISDLAIGMNRKGGLPDILIVADYGFQGEQYMFNKNQDYLQASAVLSWDLFNGFQNRSRIKQSMIEKERIDKQTEEAGKRITLQVMQALEELKTSQAGNDAAQQQVKTAREGFRLVSRKYEEGQASLIEFLDARNTLTQAEENLILSRYAYLSNYAEFEKVIANNKL